MQSCQVMKGHEGQWPFLGLFFLIIEGTHDHSIKYEKNVRKYKDSQVLTST